MAFTLLALMMGMDVVEIPAGSFEQGGAQEPDAPPRTVALSDYRIDRAEVSVTQFESWAKEGYQTVAHWSEAGWAWAQEHPNGAGAELRAAGRSGDHPVVAVTWFEAEAFCRARGGHLPTEAQWEHAACGDGQRRFPWGDSEEVSPAWSNYGKHGLAQSVGTQPVSSQATDLRSPHGLLHASGNVWEWTADWYHREGTTGDATDPSGPEEGTWRVLKGGSFTSLPSYCACAHREPAEPSRVAFTTGFRCAYAPEPSP